MLMHGRNQHNIVKQISCNNFFLSQGNQRSNCQHPLVLEKGRELQKNIYFCFIDYTKAFACMDHNKLWKILKEMGTPDHLTCLLRNLYVGQEATVITLYRRTDWCMIEKGVQGYLLSPCLFNLYTEHIMRNTRRDESKSGIKLVGEISTTSDMWIIPILQQRAKRN